MDNIRAASRGDVTRLGATIDLSNIAVTGELPWNKVDAASRPTTLAGYGITDGIAVQREVINGVEVIASAIRIKPQGDIPMFGAAPQ